MGSSWGSLGLSWRLLGRSWRLLGALGALLGRFSLKNKTWLSWNGKRVQWKSCKHGKHRKTRRAQQARREGREREHHEEQHSTSDESSPSIKTTSRRLAREASVARCARSPRRFELGACVHRFYGLAGGFREERLPPRAGPASEKRAAKTAREQETSAARRLWTLLESHAGEAPGAPQNGSQMAPKCFEPPR